RPNGSPPPSISISCDAAAANICRWRARRRPTYSPAERGLIVRNRARLFVGATATVLARLREMIDATKADEVMVTTMIYDHAARRHSYELLAEAFGLRALKNNEVPAAAGPLRRASHAFRGGSCFAAAKA